MKIIANSIEEFFAACEGRESIARELDALIRKTAPGLERELVSSKSITMLGYGMIPYKFASGEVGAWPLVAIAPQKNSFNLYVCAIDRNGKYYAENYVDDLGKVSIGRSCIRFKKLEDLKQEVAVKIIKDVEKRHLSGEKLFGL